MSTVTITYRGTTVNIETAIDRSSGGALSGVLADLGAISVQLVWPPSPEFSLLELEGASASVDGDARYRVRQVGYQGNVVRFSLEPVELQEQASFAVAGVTQDRWPVIQTTGAVPEYPYWAVTRTGPPDASVGQSYPVVRGQVGAWLGESGTVTGTPTTPVIPLETDPVDIYRDIVLLVSDGSATASGVLPVLPISVWPVVISWTSGSVAKSATYDGTSWTGDGTTGSVNASTGAYSFVLGPDIPDADTEIRISGTWQAWRAVVADRPVDAVTVDVGGHPHAIGEAVDALGQSIAIVWLAGDGSTSQAVYDGTTLEARWLYGDPSPTGAGDLLHELSLASRLTWDRGSIETARPWLNRFRVAVAYTQPTEPMEAIRALLGWLPCALVDSGDGLSVVTLDMEAAPTHTIHGQQIGETVAWGSEDVRGIVRVTWQGGTVDAIADPLRSDVAQIETQCADATSAWLVARHWAAIRCRVWVKRQIAIVGAIPRPLERVSWGGRDAIVLMVEVPASGGVVVTVLQDG